MLSCLQKRTDSLTVAFRTRVVQSCSALPVGLVAERLDAGLQQPPQLVDVVVRRCCTQLIATPFALQY